LIFFSLPLITLKEYHFISSAIAAQVV